MIKQKTVFVLGAGAHQPYGMPQGGQLLAAILRMLDASNDPNDPFAGHLINCYQNTLLRGAMQDFTVALNLSGHTSIDSFLATNAGRPGFTEIGKQAVAWQLLPLEFKHEWGRRPHNGDWMTYLFETMLHGCLRSVDDLLANNEVEFVTFNYDRTLEDFLTTRIAHTYNLQPAQAWEKAKKFKIMHVYGSLGEFNPMIIHPPIRTAWRTSIISSIVKTAAESIELMYDARRDHSGVADAVNLIAGAPFICFLGFGFDPDNITRLTLNEICADKTKVYATRFHIARGDWNRTVLRMHPALLNDSGEQFRNEADDYFNRESIAWDCLAFLHETGALG